MYLSLIRKDFSVVFRENIGLIVMQQLFILIIISLNLGIIGYGVMATAFGWQILMTVAAKDKENHSLALLVSMPYEKETIINARYVSAMLGLLGVTAVYEVLAIITNILQISFLGTLNIQVILLTFFAYSIFISVTLPLYLVFEDSVVRGISLFMILATSMVGVWVWDKTDLRFLIASLESIREYYKIICTVVAVISLIVSRNITLHLFKKMEF